MRGAWGEAPPAALSPGYHRERGEVRFNRAPPSLAPFPLPCSRVWGLDWAAQLFTPLSLPCFILGQGNLLADRLHSNRKADYQCQQNQVG